jgi:homocysteine S-methyltransferase
MASSKSLSLWEWFHAVTTPPFILLLDGGVSTYLEHILREKHQVFSHRALWSSSLLLNGEKEIIQNAHQAFCNAGADILSTVTYQCHYNTGEISDDVMTKMLRDGVQWAKTMSSAISSSSCYIAASSGCYGASLADGSEYTGDYGHDVTLSHLMDFHGRKFKVLAEESPDAVAIETIPNLLECRAVMTMLMEQECNQDGNLLNDGSRLEDALDVIQEMDPSAKYGVGINCCDSLYGTYVSILLGGFWSFFSCRLLHTSTVLYIYI